MAATTPVNLKDPDKIVVSVDYPWGISLRSRFWSQVRVEPKSVFGKRSCWEWTGPTNFGYGLIVINGKSHRAHRVAMALDGTEPGEMLVCHRCDNRKCVNPRHLFLGTPAENMHDMIAKGRAKRGMVKIADADLPRVFEMRKSGVYLRDIGSEFGVSATQILRILRGGRMAA